MVFRFGVFEFRPESGDLLREGTRVRLEPQPARALALLLARAGEVISREELKREIWGDTVQVDFDRGLVYCIGQVRSALRDSGDNPRFVETLPRRGYRFIAPVEISPPEPVLPAEPAARSRITTRRRIVVAVLTGIALLGILAWSAWRHETPRRPIVAIAAFDNETGAPEYDTWVAALADGAIDRLTALGTERLGVIGNATSLRQRRASRDLAAIQRETAADYLVFGQLQNDDGGLRLLTQLVRLDDGTHVWVTRIVRSAGHLEGVDSLVAGRIAEAVRLHVIERAPDAPRRTP